jgi:hypothetical protein
MKRLLSVLILLCGAVALIPEDPSAPASDSEGNYTQRFFLRKHQPRVLSLIATIEPYEPPASGDDGYIYGCKATWPPDYTDTFLTTNAVGAVKSIGYMASGDPSSSATTCPTEGNQYRLDIAMVRFNTAALPDNAVISAATIQFQYAGVWHDSDARNLNAEYYSSANWPIDSGDWTTSEIGTTAFSLDLTSCAWAGCTVNLSSPTTINLTGYTGFRLGISGGTPAGTNDFGFGSIDYGANYYDSILSVTYTLSSSATNRRAIIIQ